jgi:hypothetical protein
VQLRPPKADSKPESGPLSPADPDRSG